MFERKVTPLSGGLFGGPRLRALRSLVPGAGLQGISFAALQEVGRDGTRREKSPSKSRSA